MRRDWYVVDASGKTLGRLATQVAIRLRGKHKAEYTPHVDTGDHIIVLNAEKVRVTGDKLRDKIYYWHTGAIGGIKSKSLEKLMAEHPERAIEFAVKGMLPRTRSVGRCTASCTFSRATSTRTPPSSRSRSRSDPRTAEFPGPNDAREHQLRHRPPQDLDRPRSPAAGQGSIRINHRSIEEFFGRETATDDRPPATRGRADGRPLRRRL